MLAIILLFSFAFVLFSLYAAFWIMVNHIITTDYLWLTCVVCLCCYNNQLYASAFQESDSVKAGGGEVSDTLKDFSPQFIIFSLFHFFFGTRWFSILMGIVFLINTKRYKSCGYVILLNILAFSIFLWDVLSYVLLTYHSQ